MCVEHTNSHKSKLVKPISYFLIISFAILSGLSNVTLLHDVGSGVSDVFMRLFKAISLPLISLSLIVTICDKGSSTEHKSMWKKTVFYTIFTTILASLVAMILYLLIKPENVEQNVAEFKTLKVDGVYFSHLIKLVPDNLLAPFIEHQVMGVLIIGVLVGLAINQIKDEQVKHSVSNFFKGLHSIIINITSWIVAILPIALYGFIVSTILQIKSGMEFVGIGKYLAVVLTANMVQGFIILPLLLRFNGISPFKVIKGMMPALVMAFLSKSSAATLPITISSAEKNLKIRPAVSRFVLPLCTTINMNGCASFIFATVIYLMQNNGIEITYLTMFTWVIASTMAAVGNAGVPMGCFFLSASLLSGMNVPINLLGIILPFYAIIDMVETSLNVWSDSAVAKIVDSKQKA